jgi:DNA polymerase III subunit epsilon
VERIVIIDFETTGLSPREGDRATEVGAVAVKGQKIIGRYQSLMNSNTHVPSFVTGLTGITNEMVDNAPPARQVMKELAEFVGSSQLVAHNASFDRKFLNSEFANAGIEHSYKFACTVLLSKRIFQNETNYKLATLVKSLNLPSAGSFHRALADAEMTAELLFKLRERIVEKYGLALPSHKLLVRIQNTKNANIERVFRTQKNTEKQSTSSTGRKEQPESRQRTFSSDASIRRKTTRENVSTSPSGVEVGKVIIKCKACGASLRVPKEKVGNIRCPSCSNLFEANTSLPISSINSGEKVVIKCASCDAALRVPKGQRGKVRCPSCSVLFTANT